MDTYTGARANLIEQVDSIMNIAMKKPQNAALVS